jgi:hypothetical protein
MAIHQTQPLDLFVEHRAMHQLTCTTNWRMRRWFSAIGASRFEELNYALLLAKCRGEGRNPGS